MFSVKNSNIGMVSSRLVIIHIYSWRKESRKECKENRWITIINDNDNDNNNALILLVKQFWNSAF